MFILILLDGFYDAGIIHPKGKFCPLQLLAKNEINDKVPILYISLPDRIIDESKSHHITASNYGIVKSNYVSKHWIGFLIDAHSMAPSFGLLNFNLNFSCYRREESQKESAKRILLNHLVPLLWLQLNQNWAAIVLAQLYWLRLNQLMTQNNRNQSLKQIKTTNIWRKWSKLLF